MRENSYLWRYEDELLSMCLFLQLCTNKHTYISVRCSLMIPCSESFKFALCAFNIQPSSVSFPYLGLYDPVSCLDLLLAFNQHSKLNLHTTQTDMFRSVPPHPEETTRVTAKSFSIQLVDCSTPACHPNASTSPSFHLLPHGESAEITGTSPYLAGVNFARLQCSLSLNPGSLCVLVIFSQLHSCTIIIY